MNTFLQSNTICTVVAPGFISLPEMDILVYVSSRSAVQHSFSLGFVTVLHENGLRYYATQTLHLSLLQMSLCTVESEHVRCSDQLQGSHKEGQHFNVKR